MSAITDRICPKQPTNAELLLAFIGACAMIKAGLPGAIEPLSTLRAHRTIFDGPADNALRGMIDALVRQ